MVSGQKSSLTTPPTNLKEAVDWLALVGDAYGPNNWSAKGKYDGLEKALMHLPDFDGVKLTVFGDKSVQSSINALGKGLGRGFLGYQVQGDYVFSDDGIIKKEGGYYMSTYENADWPQGSTELQQCALIFLGCAVTVYYCVSYAYWRCSANHGKGDWAQQTVGSIGTYLNSFLLAMGYETNVLNNASDGRTIMDNVANELNELSTSASTSDYSGFLESLEKHMAPQNALNHPLASCYKLATAYFESQKTNATEVTQAINKFKTKFEEFSQNSEITQSTALTPNPYEPLKELITQLLSAVQKFQPKEPEQFGQGVHHGVNEGGAPTPQPSPAGPVAGALSTFGLGGGAAAAYIFNIGGAKTLVNGLLKIG
ncbi:variant erythrocyte surface antigen-1 family protein [Babesia caballi]|uniref:Variant erythrocyte surface antigen-1 family protein n=1 Tax=Babesia caballi TaxID=5871 RepID=A0AAV4LNI2_BABCB|nr:variant erythrocyte surface antigen-1 family protein [Babesia caballi]